MNIYTKKRMKKYPDDLDLFVGSQPKAPYTNEVVSGLQDGDFFTIGLLTDRLGMKAKADYFFFDDVVTNDDIKILVDELSEEGTKDISDYQAMFYIYKVDSQQEKGCKYWLYLHLSDYEMEDYFTEIF